MLNKDVKVPLQEAKLVRTSSSNTRYISIMDGLIREDDEQEMNDEENHYDNGADKERSQAFFLAYHQLMAYHCWLLFCPGDGGGSPLLEV